MQNESSERNRYATQSTQTVANLKASTHSIALRLPAHMLEGIKNAANKRDPPYQSLVKGGLQEKLVEV